MVLFGGVFGLIMIAVWLFCIVDVITTPAASVRNLPKLVWVLIVIVLVDVGSIAWLVAGRNWNEPIRVRAQALGDAAGPARPQRTARPVATNPDDDAEFLASLRVRVDEQRRRAQESKRDDPPAS